jgi:tripartite-type tricarboxylate transporter receptor subunit TctC
MHRRHFLHVMSGLCAASVLPARGQGRPSGYTDKPIRWVLGFAPGGGTDTLARALAPKVGERLGTTVIIENKPGANGNIAAEQVARAAADGLTFLFNTSSVLTSPMLYGKVAFDPTRDFVPVASVSNFPLLLLAHPSVPANTLEEFIALAKARPGQLTYASAGVGNSTHLANLLFQQAVGISAVHVPYKGGGPALSDLLAGHVQFYMDTVNTALPYVQQKQLKAFAVTGSRRLAALPAVPTLAESVSPGFEVGSWNGLLAPAGTPAAFVEKMNAAVRAVQADPAMAPVFAQQGAEVRSATPEQYGAFLKSETQRWGVIIRHHGLRIE